MKQRTVLYEYLLIIFGTLLVALAFNIFFIPHKIAPGGLSGLSTVIFYITGGKISVGGVMLILNIPLFIIGIKELGGSFGFRTILATLLLSLFTDSVKIPSLTDDSILASIYGGVIMGIGVGLVFRGNATTGGTDLLARVIHKFFHFIGVSWVLFFIDSLVVITAAMVFGPAQALYALVSLFLSSKMIDLLVEGINAAKAFIIISDHSDDIVKVVMNDLDRGVTLLKGKGAYTKQDKDVILCVTNRSETVKLKSIINEIDPKAFVLVADVKEVMGEGFSL